MSLFTDTFGASNRKVASVTNQVTMQLILTAPRGTKVFNPGSLTATVLATALSLTGAGVLNFAALVTPNTTSRTVRLRIVLDGVVIYDYSAASANLAALVGVGYIMTGGGYDANNHDGTFAMPQHIPFAESCLIQVSSSLSESGGSASVYANYELNA